jgi:tetratricopeptide (TPR) repeat protein
MGQITLMPAEDIKKAVLHPDFEVRRIAAEYLDDIRTPDVEVMPMAIRAVEQYGRGKALSLLFHMKNFPQTPQTIAWVVRELEDSGKIEDFVRGSYVMHLVEVLFNAPPDLVRPFKDRILKASGLKEPQRNKLTILFRHENDSFVELWARFAGLCRKYREEDNFGGDAVFHDVLIHLLGRFRGETAEKILPVIGQDSLEIEDDGGEPDWWMELAAIELAGDLRLEEAACTLLDRFHDEYDFRNDRCLWALVKIGFASVVERIHQRFRSAPKVFRQYASEILSHVRSTQSAAACYDLIDHEPDVSIRTELASALLGQFCPEGLDKVYELVKKWKWDSQFCDLKEDLVWACMVTGKTYPETKEWEAHARKKYETRERKMKEDLPRMERLLTRGDTDSSEPEAKASFPADMRAMEKTMFDMTRHIRQKAPKTVKGFNAFVRNFIGKVVPPLAPKDSLEAAQELAYKAFGTSDKKEKIRLAWEALRLSENCADACVILAEDAEDFKEAIRWYREGVAAGERIFDEVFFTENRGQFWGIFETRPYMRSLFGLAEALWWNDQKKEALERLRELLELNPQDNQGVRYFFSSCLLDLRKWDELSGLMERFDEDGSAEWLFNKALFYFETRGDGEDARSVLEEALESNRYVPEHLAYKEISESSFQAVRFGSEDEAIHYCQENGLFWWRNQKAMKWLMRYAFPSETFIREGPVTGRNDPCPCGSGKKYKKCCLDGKAN